MTNILVQDNAGGSTPVTLPGNGSGGAGVAIQTGGAVADAGAMEAARAAQAHGLAGKALVTAVAIAGAESQYHDTAHCLNCVPGVKEDSRGLWQINVDAHPQFANADLYNPAVNAAAMAAISNGGTDWKPWSTYINLAYLAYWPAAAAAVAQLEGGGPIAPPRISAGPLADAAVAVDQAASSPLSAIGGFLGNLTNSHTWFRVVLVVGGIGLVGLAVVKLDKGSVGGTVKDTAKSAAGAAAVAAAG